MDTSEYLPMFLAECREHLQELNLAVVRLEEQPEDRATVDEIFRIAHSLKGMSATMGFAGMAALTHEMEDVFELLRQRTRRPRRARRSTSCSSASTRSTAPSTSIEADGAEAPRSRAADRAPAGPGPRPHARAGRSHGAARPRRRRRPSLDGGRPGRACCTSRVTLADDTPDAGGARLHGARRARPSIGEPSSRSAPGGRRRGVRRPRHRRVGRLRARGRRAELRRGRRPATSPDVDGGRGRRGRRGRGRRAERARRASPRAARRRGRRASRRAPAAASQRPPPPCASTPSASTSSCTSWASSSSTARRSRSLAAQADVPGPPAGHAGPHPHARRPCRRWSCRSG